MSRIVFVTGDKGGVGKSFFSRLLLDHYLNDGRTVHAYDTDKTNSTLFRFYESLERKEFTLDQLDTDNQGELDEMMNNAVSLKDSVFMIDCGARTMDKLRSWMTEIGFLSLAKEHKVNVTIAFVIGPEKDCVQILKDSLDTFKDQVDYVVVKNSARGKEFLVYDESKTRTRILKEYKGFEIEIPALYPRTNLLVDKLSIPFFEAMKSQELGIVDQARVRSMVEKVNLEFEKVRDLWN